MLNHIETNKVKKRTLFNKTKQYNIYIFDKINLFQEKKMLQKQVSYLS